MSRNGVEFLMIQKYVLKVHMHCRGCQQKVKKILRKIEGVYSVDIDADNQLVIVSGCADSAILIKKLARSGKYAELWSPNSYQKPNEGRADIIDDNNRINSLNAPKTEHIFTNLSGNDLQEHWSLQNYLNQNNTGTSPVSGLIDQNLMATMKVKNAHMGDYVDTLEMEDDMKMKFSEGTGYGNELPPFMMMNNMEHWYQYNHPSMAMMHPNNTMDKLNYMHQTHMMNYIASPVPPYEDFSFGYAPHTFYLAQKK